MKYEVITSPFYCTILKRVFTRGQIVEIEDIKRANELVDAGLIKLVKDKKKSSNKKVKENV